MMVSSQCTLEVRQQPERAQVVQENNPKNRKPIDPPPIVELKYNDRDDPANSQWLVSPRTFMMVTLIPADEAEEQVPGKYLIGSTVSSLHRLKDHTNKDGGFFVFGDISARKLGSYRLRFSLFDLSKETNEVAFMCSIDSQKFSVLAQRDFGSMKESSYLTRTFSDQGVKLRVRKDNRAISSVSGTKRSFNASPPETSSPSNLTNMYGGAVQDQQYAHSHHSPLIKRQRAGSEYDTSQMYHGMPVAENSLGQYSSSIPSGTRAWTGNDGHRAPSGYGPQHSPMGMSMMAGGRVQQPMGLQGTTTTTWPGMQQQHSALPSPTPSASNQQQPSYPSVSAQQQSSSLFGDPGAASSIPRGYYGHNYPYSNQGQYQQSGDVPNAYSDLQMPGSSIPDSSALGSAQNQGYGQNYLQSASIYSTEGSEVPGGYAYMNETTRSTIL